MTLVMLTTTQFVNVGTGRLIHGVEATGDTTLTFTADGATVETVVLSSVSALEAFRRLRDGTDVSTEPKVVLD